MNKLLTILMIIFFNKVKANGKELTLHSTASSYSNVLFKLFGR